MNKLYFTVFAVTLLFGCSKNSGWKKSAENPNYIHRSVREVSEVMLHDIYSPPVASRIYAYITVAGYEAARNGKPKYVSLAGQVKGLDSIPEPEAGKTYCYNLAAAHAILTVGKILVMSEGRIEAFHSGLMDEFKNTGMPDDVYQNSIAYGKLIADRIIKWAGKDNYKHTRSLSKYDVQIRPFLLDSAQQFKPAKAVDFSKEPTSYFYKLAVAVREAGQHLTPEQSTIATYWDDNPFKVNTNGHTMFATKKISPGGHWINIAGLVCRQAKADYVRSAETYSCLAVVIADSFINCWDEKYKSKVIRPETYINQYIDQNWMPLLQTPPFPEYTSGHSVVSNASAVMLGKLFGDNFAFTDSTEVEFSIPARKFESFKAAADEAAISRFYGGIHYMPSIVNGIDEGRRIGNFAINKLKTRK
jgi:hypothetical protein